MSAVANNVFDVVVSGGGLVGASVALGLADRGLNIALIEPTEHHHQPLPSHDERTLVLNAASLNVLDNLDLLPDDLIRVPVRHIHINRQHGFGHLHLNALEHADLIGEDTDPTRPYFGQVVVARALGQCMLDRLANHPSIEIFCPQALVGFKDGPTHVDVSLDDGTTLSTRVLVGADGTQSLIRQQLGLPLDHHDYSQRAMVFNVAAEKPMPETAFERFTAQGPLALLPQAQGRYGVVWIDETQAIDEALKWSDETLMSALYERFGPRLGGFSKPSPRASYPLIKQHSPQVVSGRVVLVGNAANAVHPVSAQGFNLGLRDVAGLIDALCPALDEDVAQALLAYQRTRADD
ncbi:MAG TPA: FAD-dependent monooxygenase, partial [Wenzhouxiangella sp.]